MSTKNFPVHSHWEYLANEVSGRYYMSKVERLVLFTLLLYRSFGPMLYSTRCVNNSTPVEPLELCANVCPIRAGNKAFMCGGTECLLVRTHGF